MSTNPKCVLALDMQRNIVEGSPEALQDAIRKGADLRVYTEFHHNQHIDTSSPCNELIREASDFPATYLIDDRWVCAMMTLRQPATLPDRFGGRPSMSFFMYNQDGRQAIARPYLDGAGEDPTLGEPPAEMFGGGGEPKPMHLMHNLSENDGGTNAPSSNFIYDFDSYRFLVQEDWEEVLSHDAEGNVISGSAKALEEASMAGYDIKIGIRGICNGLFGKEDQLDHELFIATGPHYYYTETGFMICETRPFVRIQPQIPAVYESHNWDFGWAIVRSDGHVAGLYYDPYTLRYHRTYEKHAMRWFVRKG